MNRTVFKIIFGLAFIAIIGLFAIQGGLIFKNYKSGKSTYVINVPSLGRGAGTSYFTNEYHYNENKCLVFKDFLGFEQTICSPCTITKY